MFFAIINHSKAGLPEQDPIVANLRSRFELGTQPQLNELTQNTFICAGASAVKNRFDKFEQSEVLSFVDANSFLLVKYNNTYMNGVLHAFNGKELIGINSTYGINFAFRKDSLGYLIIEVSGQIDNRLLPLSAAAGNVGSYYYCKAN